MVMRVFSNPGHGMIQHLELQTQYKRKKLLHFQFSFQVVYLDKRLRCRLEAGMMRMRLGC